MLFTIIVESKNKSVVNLVSVDFFPDKNPVRKIFFKNDEIFNHSFDGVVSATLRTLHNGKRTKIEYRSWRIYQKVGLVFFLITISKIIFLLIFCQQREKHCKTVSKLHNEYDLKDVRNE